MSNGYTYSGIAANAIALGLNGVAYTNALAAQSAYSATCATAATQGVTATSLMAAWTAAYGAATTAPTGYAFEAAKRAAAPYTVEAISPEAEEEGSGSSEGKDEARRIQEEAEKELTEAEKREAREEAERIIKEDEATREKEVEEEAERRLERKAEPPVVATNFFATMRGWFLWITDYLARAALWLYDLPLIGYLGDLFNYLADFTSAVAGELYDAARWWERVESRISEVFDWDTIWSYILSYVPNLQEIRDWFYYWRDYVWGVITDWWAPVLSFIKDLIDTATQGLNSLVVAWDNFWKVTFPQWTSKLDVLRGEWDNLWRVTLPTLVSFDWLDIRLDSLLLDVQGLINSAIKEWSPLLESWQELRDQVVEFFTDPEEWLYKRLDSFIERFW